MKAVLPLAFAIALFAAGVASESHSSDLLRVSGDGWYTWQVAGDDELRIFARVESGQARELRIPGLQCGRGDTPEAEDLGLIDAAESVAWLSRFISPPADVTTEVMAAISAHPGGTGTQVLENVVRSDSNRQNRKEAVFWLAQTDDDDAFAFLDSLLSASD